MAPSKKVWHGIYNDLHPGKRWPSVAMSFLLIFTLVVIGHLNTNNSRQSAYLSSKISEDKKLTHGLKKTGSSKSNQKIVLRKNDLNKSKEVFVYSTGNPDKSIFSNEASENKNQIDNFKRDRLLAGTMTDGNNSGTSVFEKLSIPNPPTSSSTIDNNSNIVPDKESQAQNNVRLNGKIEENIQEKIIAENVADLQSAKRISTGKKNSLNSEDVLRNKNIDEVNAQLYSSVEKKEAKHHKKGNDKITWVYFLAPVVSSVSFSGHALTQSANANFSPAVVVNLQQNKVLHNSALGLEAGAQMNYTVAKKLQFTTGAHLTHSGYNIISNEVHPTFGTLLLRDKATGAIYTKSFITHYGNGTGPAVVKIRNYNWEASIPFGLQYEVFENKKLQFKVGANLEPSLLLKYNSYILSSDGNNYVNDPSLLRRWNMSSNFGAFVTFNSSKFKWQIGPNVRYQWLSSYQKDYTIKEHLIDYGIRVGISK
ncbi:MAG: hypothetical protein ABI834_04980 [Ginsengibacter sp.]